MTESAGGDPGAERRCPWCSSTVPAAAQHCPACGAALPDTSARADEDIPGVTQVDPVLGIRRQLPRPNRLVGWLADVDPLPTPTTGVVPGAATPGGGVGLEGTDATSIAPPSDAVRREMRRLELEAIKAELEARAGEARLAAMDAGQAPPVPPASDDEDPAGG